MSLAYKVAMLKSKKADLIFGGGPAGFRKPPGVVDWRMKRKHIMIITRQGKNKTRPKGIEALESLVNRTGLLKKAKRSFCRFLARGDSFRLGYGCGEGIRFLMLCTKSIYGGHTSGQVPCGNERVGVQYLSHRRIDRIANVVQNRFWCSSYRCRR